MKKYTVFILLTVFFTGCAGVPFEPVRFSSIESVEPETMRQKFETRLAASFEIAESVVFKYRRHQITAVGYTRVTDESSFVSAGFTPSGLKIFEIKGTPKEIESSFSLPSEISEKIDQKEMGQAMAEDFWRIYFGRVPGPDAEVIKARDRVYFREPSGQGTLEFIFGGPDQSLVQKRYFEGGDEMWNVRYFSYQQKNGKIYPSKVFYQNLRGKYEITLRLKEIES